MKTTTWVLAALATMSVSTSFATPASAQGPKAPLPMQPQPQLQPPSPVPGTTTQAATPPPVPTEEIDPPPKASGGPISLEESVKRAMERNPSVEVARQDILRLQGLARQVRSTWFPLLGANVVYTRVEANRDFSGRLVTPANVLTANVQLTVPIVAAKQWVAWDRSLEQVDIARTVVVDTRRTIAVAAARAYLTQIAQRRVLQSAQRALVTAKAHEDYSKTRFGGGVGNRLDYVRAAEERASAEVLVRQETTALNRAQEALGVIVGSDKPLDTAEEPMLPAPPNVDSAYGLAVKRPDIVAQEQRVETSRRAVRDSWTDYLPYLTGIAQPVFGDPATSTVPAAGWQAQLLLGIPLYDGGLRYGQYDERKGLEGQARARLEAALRQVKSDVRVAFEALKQADEALVGAREASQLAREALELSQLAYRAGATTNIEVIDAERRSQDADIAFAVAEDTSRQARLDLLDACGRFP